MPVYIPTDYREVTKGVLTVSDIRIVIQEVAESGQRFITFTAAGAEGCAFEVFPIPHNGDLGEAVKEVMESVSWNSMLMDVPF